jgi:hypothetical protein
VSTLFRLLVMMAMLTVLGLSFQQEIEHLIEKTGISWGSNPKQATPASLEELRYADPALDELRQELASLDTDPNLVKAELSWLQHRKTSCPDNSADGKKCWAELNQEHQRALQRRLINLLLHATSASTSRGFNLPTQLDDEVVPHQRRRPMAFAPEAGILLSMRRRSREVLVSDLSKGEVINTISSSNENSIRGTGLSLSPNGRLALFNNEQRSQLISTFSGKVLRQFDHFSDSIVTLSPTGAFILEWNAYQVTLHDTVSGEMLTRRPQQLLDVRALPRSSNRRVYDPKSSTLFNWNSRGKGAYALHINGGKNPEIRKGRSYPLPANFTANLENATFNPRNETLLLLTRTDIHELDLVSGNLRRVAPLDIQARRVTLLADGPYLFISGKSELKNRDAFVTIHIPTGRYAYANPLDGSVAAVLPLPVGSMLLTASDRGIGLLPTEPSAHSYIYLDIEREKKEERAYAATGKMPEPETAIASAPSVYKCTKASGQTIYSDAPCPGQERQLAIAPASPASKPPVADLYRVGRGENGLREAVKKGVLRPANPTDLERWLVMRAYSGNSEKMSETIRRADKYVILRPAGFLGGLNGANARVFIVTRRENAPIGDLGHSAVLYAFSGACTGALCGR